MKIGTARHQSAGFPTRAHTTTSIQPTTCCGSSNQPTLSGINDSRFSLPCIIQPTTNCRLLDHQTLSGINDSRFSLPRSAARRSKCMPNTNTDLTNTNNSFPGKIPTLSGINDSRFSLPNTGRPSNHYHSPRTGFAGNFCPSHSAADRIKHRLSHFPRNARNNTRPAYRCKRGATSTVPAHIPSGRATRDGSGLGCASLPRRRLTRSRSPR